MPMPMVPITCWMPTNSASRRGSPSSRSISITSRRLRVEFVKCFALSMCARKTRHVAHVKAGVRASFNHSGKTSHDVLTDPPISQRALATGVSCLKLLYFPNNCTTPSPRCHHRVILELSLGHEPPYRD